MTSSIRAADEHNREPADGVAVAEETVLQGYALHAADLILSFEALDPCAVLAPVLELLPRQPSSILEVGAGTGRDAAWLAARGHTIVAVEPVNELRRAGMDLHRSPNIGWVDDHLPALAKMRSLGRRYDLILGIAVWQHLRPEHHSRAISTLSALTAPGGCLILSLRHGPGSPARPCFPADPDQVIGAAEAKGLRLLLRRAAPSVQRKNREAGVTWTWLGLGRLA
jgi:SAM-dependent methyltransferase